MTQTVAIDQTQTTVVTASANIEYHRFNGVRSEIFDNMDEHGYTLVLAPVNCEGQAFGSKSFLNEIRQYHPEAFATYKNKCQGTQARLLPGKLVFSKVFARKPGKMVQVLRNGKPVTDRSGEPVMEYRAGEVVLNARNEAILAPFALCFVPVKLSAGNRERASAEFALQGLQRLVELDEQHYLKEHGFSAIRTVKLVTGDEDTAEAWDSFGPALLDKLCLLENMPATIFISARDKEYYYDENHELVYVAAPDNHWRSQSEDLGAMM